MLPPPPIDEKFPFPANHNTFISVEICILCWVKFYTFESHMAAWVATGLLIPIFFIFIAFAAHFYLKVMNCARVKSNVFSPFG